MKWSGDKKTVCFWKSDRICIEDYKKISGCAEYFQTDSYGVCQRNICISDSGGKDYEEIRSKRTSSDVPGLHGKQRTSGNEKLFPGTTGR